MDQLNGEFILNGGKPGESIQPDPVQSVTTSSKSPHFYSSFCRFPSRVSFAELEANENILLLLRRHFATNIPWITATILLILLPFAFPFFIHFFPFPLPSQHTIVLFIGFYYLVVAGFVLLNFTLWYFQVGLVTNMRVIDVDLSGILYRQISETKIKNIEDVTYSQTGFIRSLFNYGNVLVQTAGTEENIEYDRVPRPSIVAEIIGDLSRGS